MSISLESVERINTLKNSIEAITGESYDNLTAGVQALKNGYGQGGGTAESKPEQEKTVDVTENGIIEVLPDEGSVLSKVTVNVDVETGLPLTGITDFTGFWSHGRRSEIFDVVDTSEGVCFDNVFDRNTTMTRLPQHFKLTNKATSISNMFTYCEGITELPEDFDTSNCENFESAFSYSNISVFKSLNTSKGKNFSGMCSRNGSLHAGITVIPDLDMSNAENCYSMFYNTKLSRFPLKNTSKVTTFRQAFGGCYFTEAELDLTSCTDMRSAFNNCEKLKKLTLRNTQQMTSRFFEACFTKCKALEDLSIDYLNIVDNYLDFSACTSLTVNSLVNILNALSDNTSLTTTYTVKLGSTNLAKLSAEQKAIATNKNINLT